jgi:hypothetical protein
MGGIITDNAFVRKWFFYEFRLFKKDRSAICVFTRRINVARHAARKRAVDTPLTRRLRFAGLSRRAERRVRGERGFWLGRESARQMRRQSAFSGSPKGKGGGENRRSAGASAFFARLLRLYAFSHHLDYFCSFLYASHSI